MNFEILEIAARVLGFYLILIVGTLIPLACLFFIRIWMFTWVARRQTTIKYQKLFIKYLSEVKKLLDELDKKQDND